MKTIYIDERFVKSENKTIFSIVILSDKELKEIYKKVKEVIIAKEKRKDKLSSILSDVKLHKIRSETYMENIEIILDKYSRHHYFKQINASKEDPSFAERYASLLEKVFLTNEFEIKADIIDTRKFTETIIKRLNNKNIKFVNSFDECGIQIADLFMYKLKKL